LPPGLDQYFLASIPATIARYGVVTMTHTLLFSL
jgi:hypothetical protein